MSPLAVMVFNVVMQGKQFYQFSSPCMFKKFTTAFLSKEAEKYEVPPVSGITGNNLGMRKREEKKWLLHFPGKQQKITPYRIIY